MQQQQTINHRIQTASVVLSTALLLICLVPAKARAAQQNNEVDVMCMLDEHNTLRANVGVPNLRWSEPLARQAATWADTLKRSGCTMKHSHVARIGENLYWASPLKTGSRNKGKSAWKWRLTPQPIKEKTVVAAWATEQPWYSRSSNTCEAPPGKTCGHYTQMVWKTTTEVGCGKAICEDSSQVWVCNYAPASNVVGQRPY